MSMDTDGRNELRRTIDCGKVDWFASGRKVNRVELELSLRKKGGKWCFSCCGSVWNARHTDIVAGGQCLDEMFGFKELAPWKEIHRLWSAHHLNDLCPGSPKQTEAVEKWREKRRKAGKWNGGWDYEEACEMLRKKGLLVDESYVHDGKPYEYGTAWLTREIPEEDVKAIAEWIDGTRGPGASAGAKAKGPGVSR